jgi:aromatic-L-amino-acid decarboxylase
LPYATGNTQPRFFGWVHGTGTVEGALAELAAGFMNCNVGGREHGAVCVKPPTTRAVLCAVRESFPLARRPILP